MSFQDLVIKGGMGIQGGRADAKLQMARCTVSGSTSHGVDMMVGSSQSDNYEQLLQADDCVFSENGGFGIHLYGRQTNRDDGICVSAILSKCTIRGNKSGSVLAHATTSSYCSATVTLQSCDLDKPAEQKDYGKVIVKVRESCVHDRNSCAGHASNSCGNSSFDTSW